MAKTGRRSGPDPVPSDRIEGEQEGPAPPADVGSNAAADAKRRQIERKVYARRTATDREAEAEGPTGPRGKAV